MAKAQIKLQHEDKGLTEEQAAKFKKFTLEAVETFIGKKRAEEQRRAREAYLQLRTIKKRELRAINQDIVDPTYGEFLVLQSLNLH